MIVFIPLMVMGSCVCVYYAYTAYSAAQIYHAQAEAFLRMGNERLFEADRIWRKIAQNHAKKSNGGKVLPFDRHLKSVPLPKDDGPNAA